MKPTPGPWELEDDEALPSLEDLRIPPEIVEAAELYLCTPGTHGAERETVERLVRLVAYHLRCRDCQCPWRGL